MIEAMLLALAFAVMPPSAPPGANDASVGETATVVLRREAGAVEPLVNQARQGVLKATADLPPSTLNFSSDEAKKTYISEAAAGSRHPRL